jgi:hypothetical protein
MTITRFEDIHAWQAARELCKLVYRVTGTEGSEVTLALPIRLDELLYP